MSKLLSLNTMSERLRRSVTISAYAQLMSRAATITIDHALCEQ
jgi:hypothetical protein